MIYDILRAASSVATVVSRIAVIDDVSLVDDFILGAEWVSDVPSLYRLDLGLDFLSDNFLDVGAGLSLTISQDSLKEPDPVLTREGSVLLASPL